MTYPSAHGNGGHAIAHARKVVQMSDYEHLRPKQPFSLVQFWFDCMFWWMR